MTKKSKKCDKKGAKDCDKSTDFKIFANLEI